MVLGKSAGSPLALWGILLLAALLLIACQQGPPGPPGAPGAAGVSTGSITGTVTNKLAGSPLTGVTVKTDPEIKGVTITTDANGKYSATLPIGVYTLTFARKNFTSATQSAALAAGQTVSKDVALAPTAPVVVSVGEAQKSAPGGTVTLKATVEPLDGSKVSSYKWTQTSGAAATLKNADTDTAAATLGDATAYKNNLFKNLETLDRFVVQAVNPHSREAAETASFKVTVTTSSGTYSATAKVTVPLSYATVSPGLQNVPVNVPVLLHGKTQEAYEWKIAAPEGSKAALDDAKSPHPAFTPDVAGKYVLTEEKSKTTLDIYAGTWLGVITGQDAKGRPVADGACTACHNGKVAPDKFTAWKESGHAEIFSQNINNPQGHWGVSCASCHTVGYNPEAANNGFDEALAKEGWKVPPQGEKGLWTTLLAKYPGTARLANIQCENCHGPQQSAAHTKVAARTTLSADACGTCHGEPLRHARFQQWEESGHGNYDLAILDATVENRAASAAHCGRCHSGQGFLAWIKQGDLTKQIQGAKGNATVDELKALGLTKDKVQPQTCAVCHDPHQQGTVSGEPNTASVRIMDNTAMLAAGFKAEGLGRGALCITCHNSRNAVHSDVAGLPPSYSAPHTAAQGDVLMGENAYFVTVGARSRHSYLKDTCVTCHMELTPPPVELSYQLSGTNHSFKASKKICTSCHGAFDGGTLQQTVEADLHELAKKMSDYLLKKMPDKVQIIDYTPHTYAGKSYDLKSAAVTIDKANLASVELTEPHGQQGFLFKFKSPVTFTYSPPKEAPHSVALSVAEVQLGDITLDGTKKLIGVDDPLVRVGWNFFLIEGDGSKGIHNPSFTLEVLNASLAALK